MRILMLAALLVVTPVLAGTPYVAKKRCPIGGERFDHVETVSYSTWGARPDGKPYGSWEFPLALPVCPGNRLVMYRDFTPDEVARLKPMVASTTYRALASETPYYRAAWLARTLDPASDEALGLLYRAIWESDDDPARRARYLRTYVAAVAALPASDEIGSIGLRARAANALRELGDFDAAAAALAALPVASLDVPVPAPRGKPVPGSTGVTVENYAEIEAAKQRRGLLGYTRNLGVVIARRDASAEPVDMIPRNIAADRCAGPPRRTDAPCTAILADAAKLTAK
ncbi:hypothetical protein [Glacieibacterium frigidum]|uniref:Uncharacterized protein n=1 Tax=Glacieibacterium frigidum TaxID=2593303 RepID=A0A552UFJ3_9SPHN|nr:hypothetical protein [Glacieibacterium frigidum]TRW16961.1 hypothetical protein FMM06_01765 [Glacieibacterium frigidum]